MKYERFGPMMPAGNVKNFYRRWIESVRATSRLLNLEFVISNLDPDFTLARSSRSLPQRHHSVCWNLVPDFPRAVGPVD